MHHFKVTIQRKKGMGCKFLKFHQVLHLSDDMRRLGAISNVSTQGGESGHKDNAKFPAITTQRQVKTFLPQVAKSYVRNIAIDRAFTDIDSGIEIIKCHNGISYHGKRFFYLDQVIYDYKKKINKHSYKSCKNWNDTTLMFEVKQFFDNQIIPCLKEGSTIDMYTYCKVNGNMIRGDPLFQDKIHWHDWFYANNLTFTKERGKIDKHVPVQVISFLHIVGIEKPITGYPNSKQKFSIKKDGFYALVHYVPLPLSYTYFEGKDKNHLAHQDSLLMYYSRKTLVSLNIRMQRDLILINMNNFHSTCIAINDVQPAPYKKMLIFF